MASSDTGSVRSHSPDLHSETSYPETRMSSLELSDQEVFIGSALVIGGCGFLGHHIVRELLNEPTCTSVSVMSRSPFLRKMEGVAYHIGDISNIEHVQHVLEQVRPHVVFNTASPHAYVDHKSVPATFACNVDGNRNLLQIAGEVGTVRAYIYTSSAPIISTPGGFYDHADETFPTLAVPVLIKGDPYHVAKSMGEKLVLEANRKNGIRTACIRPTALYGEGDHQLVEPTIRALENGVTKVWMGHNDAWMDVVYVGHVARVQILAAKGLLAGLVDPEAPKVDGEAFNVTDDEPAHPLDFFRKYWALAGDNTPMSSVWMIHPVVVMMMAHIAEFFVWAISLGANRPLDLKKERMEFILLTRTYSIKKARERLGFKPWDNQPHVDQEAAVKASVEWYLSPENHGPVQRIGFKSWPETPFKLISETGALAMTDLPANHYCIKNARIMAATHNTIFRALNSIYHHASIISPGTQEAADLLTFCTFTYEFIYHHQLGEEMIYFPEIEKAAGKPGLMQINIDQHAAMDEGLLKFHKYAENTRKENFDGVKLRELIDAFKPAYEKHQHEEIQTILNLHNVVDSNTLKEIDVKFRKHSEKHSDIFKAAPLVMGCQDTNFLLDGEKFAFPDAGLVAPYAVQGILSLRHFSIWRFLPSTMHGLSLPPPTARVFNQSKTSSTEASVLLHRYSAVGVLFVVAFMLFRLL